MFVQEEDKDWKILLKHITYGENYIDIWDDWVKIWKNVGRINNFVFRKIIIIFALEIKKARIMKALFLDIDGVIQAHGDQKRFKHREEFVELSKRLTTELNNGFDYYKFGGDYRDANHRDAPTTQYDIAAVYYDWRPEVVARLRRILETTRAKIVLSSDWREKGLENMRGLLDIHGLGKYLYLAAPFCVPWWASFMKQQYSQEQLHEMDNETRQMFHKINCKLREFYNVDNNVFFDGRSGEIKEFLDRHREIDAYVALDDRDLSHGLDGHFVEVSPYLKDEQAEKAIEILDIQNGPYPLPNELKTDELEQWRRKWVYGNKNYQ
jgi:hypothetical protein